MLTGAMLAKVATAAGYVVLGWLVPAEEFGTYAFVLGIAVVARALQDQGVREILISRPPSEFREHCRSVLIYGAALNAAAVMLLAGLGALVRSTQGPAFPLTLALVAFSIICGTPWPVGAAKLSLQRRFHTLSLLTTSAVVVQYSVAIIAALVIPGAVALTGALVAAAVFKGASACWILRSDLRASGTPLLRRYFGESAALILGSAAFLLSQEGDYLVAGLMVSASATGIYYFAYQVPYQFASALGAALHSVLLPFMASTTRERPDETARLLMRSSESLLLSMAMAGSMLALLAPYIEQVVWRGRWGVAVLPITIMSLFMPARALVEPMKALYLGSGRFRRWILEAASLATGVVTGGLVGSTISTTPLGLTFGVGLGLSIMVSTMLWRTVVEATESRAQSRAFALRMLGTYILTTGLTWVVALAATLDLIEHVPGRAHFIAVCGVGTVTTIQVVLLRRTLVRDTLTILYSTRRRDRRVDHARPRRWLR